VYWLLSSHETLKTQGHQKVKQTGGDRELSKEPKKKVGVKEFEAGTSYLAQRSTTGEIHWGQGVKDGGAGGSTAEESRVPNDAKENHRRTLAKNLYLAGHN